MVGRGGGGGVPVVVISGMLVELVGERAVVCWTISSHLATRDPCALEFNEITRDISRGELSRAAGKLQAAVALTAPIVKLNAN